MNYLRLASLVVHLLNLPHILVKCAALSDFLLLLSGLRVHLVNVVLGHEIELALDLFLAKPVIVDPGQPRDVQRIMMTTSDQDRKTAHEVPVVW